eukprot:1453708-Amphidinium_carterae.1
MGEIESDEVEVNRGVLQGCPSSPLLFLACLSAALLEAEGQWHRDPFAGWHYLSSYDPVEARRHQGELAADS